MTLDEYQTEARKTATYPYIGGNLNYPIVALCGEAGELANEWKKVLRKQDSLRFPTGFTRDRMLDELGDVLWYVSAVASELGVKRGKVYSINANDWGGWWSSSGNYWGGRGGGGMFQNAVQNVGLPSEVTDGTLSIGQISVSASVNVSFLIE